MEQILSKSRTILKLLLFIVGRTRSGEFHTKDIRTLQSRHSCVITFIKNNYLSNNIASIGFLLTIGNISMVCYTAHLPSGATLLCKTISANVIKRYISAAAMLF